MKTAALSFVALAMLLLPSMAVAGNAPTAEAPEPALEPPTRGEPVLDAPLTDEQGPLAERGRCVAATITDAEPPLAMNDDWTCYGCSACTTGLCCLKGTGWTCVSSCSNECNPPVFPEG